MCSTLILIFLFLRSLYKTQRSVNLTGVCSCRQIPWTWSCVLPYQAIADPVPTVLLLQPGNPDNYCLKYAVFKHQFKLPDKAIVHGMCK